MMKKVKFYYVYKYFVLAIISIMAGILAYLWFSLNDYEKHLPEKTMDVVFSEMKDGDYSRLVENGDSSLSTFCKQEDVNAYIKQIVDGKDLSYKKKTGEFKEEHPVYVILCGEDALTTVSLKSVKTTFYGNTVWEVENVGKMALPSYDMTVTAPNGATVTVNGTQLSADYVSESDIIVDSLKDLPDYISCPTMTKYVVPGVLGIPEVSVTAADGTAMEISTSEDNKEVVAGYPGKDGLLSAYGEQTLNIAQTYTKYMAADTSLTDIAQYVDGNAEIYQFLRTSEVYWFTSHDSYEFTNTEAYDATKYDDNIFSISVKYDYTIYRNGESFYYPTDLTFVYANVDGNLKVEDIIIN